MAVEERSPEPNAASGAGTGPAEPAAGPGTRGEGAGKASGGPDRPGEDAGGTSGRQPGDVGAWPATGSGPLGEQEAGGSGSRPAAAGVPSPQGGSGFEEAAERAAPALGGAALRELAARIGTGWPDQAILAAVRDEEAVAAVLAARRSAGVGDDEAAAFLRGLAAGYARGSGAVRVETVWSGPASHAVPVRATSQALLEVIDDAARELVLMTYSARPHDRIREALAAAAARGVRVDVVVETLQGAGGAISGAEPAAAFAGLGGVELWHWPVGQRAREKGKAHAKLAAADRRVLLVSSANLTQSGVADNIEAGLLVRGGEAPRRIAEHVAELRTRGVLVPLYGGGRR
ncbi:hypothetical protein F4561_001927 [Lipingzhangella halophila]|uniref:PLD phosphodiesterase domain-containing protein n=1 Tax=Lipingzhangella halophila TaxID=1783352 RepID=A0A7W7W1L6_9ACTN|nr:DISARM system phospholipase D-like protein DrmC [Lipingzhangella halophila]MBB4931107.1 hypothetical protein [Lipingzhangella halophila]